MSPAVLDHVRNPRNVGLLDRRDSAVGVGVAGSVARGGLVKISIRVGDEGRIEDARFQAYGCPSAIASASLAATLVRGESPGAAVRIGASRISTALDLPAEKAYCASLATDAVRAAVRDYDEKRGAIANRATAPDATARTAGRGGRQDHDRKGFPE